MDRRLRFDPEGSVLRLVEILGLNAPTKTSRDAIALQLGISASSLDRITYPIQEAGFLLRHYTNQGRNIVKGDGSGQRESTPIKASVWTLTADAPTILKHARAQGWLWGRRVSPMFQRVSLPAATEARPGGGVIRGTVGGGLYVSPAGPEAESPFSVLQPLKRDEAAAMIEAARQYVKRDAFIDEEIARFKAYGLALNRDSIGAPKDEVLAHVGLVVDYVSRLERENDRLQARSAVEFSTEEATNLRAQLRQERLSEAERAAQARVAVDELRHHYDNDKRMLERRIAILEADLASERGIAVAAGRAAERHA